MSEATPLWRPDAKRAESTLLSQFMGECSAKAGRNFRDYWDLHRWSIDDLNGFWAATAEYCGIKWQKPPTGTAYEAGKTLRDGKWFPGARLNFAENLLPPSSDQQVIISIAEGRREPVRYTASRLKDEVAACMAALASKGVKAGDRVAGVIANCPEAIVAMLATTGLGAVWSSCSPDFGVNGIVDRLGQVEPKVLFYTTRYHYNGKGFDCRATIKGCLKSLPSIKTAVAVPLVDDDAVQDELSFADFVESGRKAPAASFQAAPFDHPAYIMFSSGTTGVPKCIVHSAGGTLLQHKKELMLHGDIKPGDRLLYFTTCGWMMWNWMVSALSVGACLVLFEGSVAYPDMGVLWETVAHEKVTHFGTSPKFIAATMKAELEPASRWQFPHLRTMFSTGSPLLPEHFSWVYEHVGEDIHLASISGGTDIISCFMLGVPTLPVYSGEIQAPGLGMAVEAWDEEGKPVVGKKGELVCTAPFASMPAGFWNDPDGHKYREAYFTFYQNQEVWRHGDYIEVTPRGGIIVYGRSDATLNPGGVRIGTAEIYRQVEALPGILDTLAVGYEHDGDVDIWLFLKLAQGEVFTAAMEEDIKRRIRRELTPRHVPRRILPVKDIPYTRSGKKVEMAVKQALAGETVANLGALANPEAMDEFFAMGEKIARGESV